VSDPSSRPAQPPGDEPPPQGWEWAAAPQVGPAAEQEPLLVSIGDIGVSQSWVVTPSGTRPVSEVQWMFTDMSRRTEAIPTWAIVLAVVLAWACLLSLLLLLVKEERTDGAVQVVVQSPGFLHSIQLPVSNPAQVADYSARVNYARGLSAAASA
jgi:hypothetical protein